MDVFSSRGDRATQLGARTMKWEAERDPDGHVVLCAEADDSSDRMIARALDEAMAVVAREVLPAHAAEDWEVLRVELWPDTARMLVYPATRAATDRIDRCMVQLTWPVLRRAWDRFEAADEEDEDEEARFEEVRDRFADAFVQAFARSGLRCAVEIFEYEERVRSLGETPQGAR